MSSNTIPIDLDRDKMVLLLKRLTQGRLEIKDAHELKILLEKEYRNAKLNKNNQYETQLMELINILDDFISGKIDLRTSSVVKHTTHKYSIQ